MLGLHNQFLLCHAQQSAACNDGHHLEARLGRWLLRAHDLYGPSFALTQEALAAFLGVSAQALQNLGIIRYRRGVIEWHANVTRRCACNRERLRLKATAAKALSAGAR